MACNGNQSVYSYTLLDIRRLTRCPATSNSNSASSRKTFKEKREINIWCVLFCLCQIKRDQRNESVPFLPAHFFATFEIEENPDKLKWLKTVTPFILKWNISSVFVPAVNVCYRNLLYILYFATFELSPNSIEPTFNWEIETTQLNHPIHD